MTFLPCVMSVDFDVLYKVRALVFQRNKFDANADVVSEIFRCPEGAQKRDFGIGPLEICMQGSRYESCSMPGTD